MLRVSIGLSRVLVGFSVLLALGVLVFGAYWGWRVWRFSRLLRKW